MITDLLNHYTSLTEDCPIKSINSKFSYYLADDLDVNIKCDAPLVYYDIESAFPSILHFMLDGKAEHRWYLDGLDALHNDKIKRLIFISTNAPKVKENLLQELNSMAKIIVFSKVYNLYSNIQILEYKKDSLLVKADLRSSPKFDEVEDILNPNFKFHVDDNIDSYYRFERTSIYVSGDDIDLKGILKDMPVFITASIIPMLSKIVDDVNLQNTIKSIYSSNYYRTLIKFGQYNKISEYYAFGDKYLSNYSKTFTSTHSPDCASATLLRIIYPLVAMFKS